MNNSVERFFVFFFSTTIMVHFMRLHKKLMKWDIFLWQEMSQQSHFHLLPTFETFCDLDHQHEKDTYGIRWIFHCELDTKKSIECQLMPLVKKSQEKFWVLSITFTPSIISSRNWWQYRNRPDSFLEINRKKSLFYFHYKAVIAQRLCIFYTLKINQLSCACPRTWKQNCNENNSTISLPHDKWIRSQTHFFTVVVDVIVAILLFTVTRRKMQ